MVGQPCRDHPPSVVVSVKRRRAASHPRRASRRSTRTGISSARATCARKSSRSARISRPASKAAGANASDIILTRAYVTDTDAFSKNADMRARYLGPESRPAPCKARCQSSRQGPTFLVEIEAVAAVD